MRQGQRRQHEKYGRAGGQLVHEGIAAAGAEHGLASARAERCTHLGPLARLKQDDPDHGDTHEDMKKYKYVKHCLLLFSPVTGLN